MAFKKLLKTKNITQVSISNTLGCNQSLVSKWCRGVCEPSLNSIIEMSKNFNIPIEEIVLSFKKGGDSVNGSRD